MKLILCVAMVTFTFVPTEIHIMKVFLCSVLRWKEEFDAQINKCSILDILTFGMSNLISQNFIEAGSHYLINF